MMTTEWYYAKDGQRHGPITSEQLKDLADSGVLRSTDLVWSEGQTDWEPAMTVDGLFPTKAVILDLPSDKIRQFVNSAAENGISPSVAFPSVWRIVWRLGVDLPPPHFMSFWHLTLFSGTLAGILCGILTWITGWESGFIGMVGLLGGGLIGLSVALYYTVRGRTLDFPPWSEMPNDGDDGASSSRPTLGNKLKAVLTMDGDSAELNKWFRVVGCIGVGLMLFGRLYTAVTDSDESANRQQEVNSSLDSFVGEFGIADGEKLSAFKTLVSAYESGRSDASLSDISAHVDRVKFAQQQFIAMQFDPAADPEQARAIVELHFQRVYGNFGGVSYNILDDNVINKIWGQMSEEEHDKVTIPARVLEMWSRQNTRQGF